MKQQPNFELLKDAYQIIGGIPAHQINLDYIVAQQGDADNHCGTIACAMGWLGLHPKFRALGIITAHSCLVDEEGRSASYTSVAARVFNISQKDAQLLFGMAHAGLANNKKIFQSRVIDYLRQHGQLKEQLEATERAAL